MDGLGRLTSVARGRDPPPAHGRAGGGPFVEAVVAAQRPLADSRPRTSAGRYGPLAIGLALTLIHLISIPVTNTSVNPARSTGPAIFVGGWALEQLWLFWVAPIVGAVAAGFLYKGVLEGEPEAPPVTGRVKTT